MVGCSLGARFARFSWRSLSLRPLTVSHLDVYDGQICGLAFIICSIHFRS